MVLNRQLSTRTGPENVIRPRQQLTVAATRILVTEPVFRPFCTVFRPFCTVFRSFRKFSAPSVQFSAHPTGGTVSRAFHPSKTQPTVLRFRLKICENIPPPPAGISPGRGPGTQPPPTIPGKLTRSQDPCPSAVKERYTAVVAEKHQFFCHGRTSCTFPGNRIGVSVHAQLCFLLFRTVPHALPVHVTRFRPR